MRILKHGVKIFRAATAINGRSRMLLAAKKYSVILHLHRQKVHQSAVTIQLFARASCARKEYSRLLKLTLELQLRRNAAAIVIQNFARKKNTMSFFKFWKQLANEMSTIINSKFARRLLAMWGLVRHVRAANRICGCWRVWLARRRLGMLKFEFMEESRIAAQQNLQNMYPIISPPSVDKNGAANKILSPAATTAESSAANDIGGDGDGDGDGDEDDPSSPVVWQLRYSPHNKASIQGNENFIPGSQEFRKTEEQRAEELRREEEEEERRLDQEKRNLEEEFKVGREHAETKMKEFVARSFQAIGRGNCARKTIRANVTLVKAGRIAVAKIQRRKRELEAEAEMKMKHERVLKIQTRVRVLLARKKVRRVREERLAFLTELMESEFSYKYVTEFRSVEETGGGIVNDFDYDIGNADVKDADADADPDVDDAGSNDNNRKWLKMCTEASRPPHGCKFSSSGGGAGAGLGSGEAGRFKFFELNF